MKVGVIADDLTGANATGVRLAKQGFKTATVVRDAPFPSSNVYDAICVDTDSRYVAKEIAKKRVRKVISDFKEWNTKVFCKRIDSTIRGNIGVEIDAVLDELGESAIAIVVPSFPDSGRITTGGYLLVGGVPVQDTDVANDPITPITKSYVPAIIKDQSEYKVGLISLDTILAGAQAIVKELRKQMDNGIRVIVCDAVNDEQIESIAHAMASFDDKMMVPVDPGPLTAFYAKCYLHQKVEEQKLLVTIGSVTSLTGHQIHYLLAKTNASPVYVDPNQLASYSDSWQKEVDRAINEGLEALKSQSILVVTTHNPKNKIIDLRKLAESEQVSEDALAKRITDGLAVITRKIIELSSFEISGCFTSGGDVTASLCAVGRANGIELLDEVLPLAAYGRLVGGHLNGLHIVTKGGMIGDNRAIYESVKFLQTKILSQRGAVLND
ncbi:four-carbon acid sugar kinase family protein [Tuberibacillus calidus]|jgi:uncharacterized protein YgbK (DUF1537 family)|uniref:four-carbon acid sugar kinase family protein n=1 Tax=Tuberibacillus calidus TaxID=340097 RepID=UPI0004040716|nr:four-carbon acid sugar kinase family protein [Tuberibacillus calidus]